MRKNDSTFSFTGILVVAVAFGLFLNYQAQKDNLSFTDEFRKTFFTAEWNKEQQEKERAKGRAEAEKWLQKVKEAETKQAQADRQAEAANAKQTRLDPRQAKWSSIKQQSQGELTATMLCDTNGDNIYINENGNVMNLLAVQESGTGHDLHGNPMHLDPNDYLVMVMEIDINNNRKRIVDGYRYNIASGQKSASSFDPAQHGNWETNQPDFLPNYFSWIKENYSNFYRLPH